jgi:predicted dehydrogenase
MSVRTLSAAIIGTGRGYRADAAHSVGYLHAEAYRTLGCPIVGACALSEEHATRFGRKYAVEHVGSDYRTVLAESRPDIVSVTTYADSHRAVIETAVSLGVSAVWCEKPLSLTPRDSHEIAELCLSAGVKLIVNHQRRYLDLFRTIRRLLGNNAIGRPVLLTTIGTNWDLIEWGSHWLDLFRYLVGDPPGRWVMGQVCQSGPQRRYGHLVESHGIAYGALADGTRFLLEGGEPAPGEDEAIRIIGTDGLLEVLADGTVRLFNRDGQQRITAGSDFSWPADRTPDSDPYVLALGDLLSWLRGGPEPGLNVCNAVASGELVLGAYESALRADRVDLPLRDGAQDPLRVLARQQETSRA